MTTADPRRQLGAAGEEMAMQKLLDKRTYHHRTQLALPRG